MMKEYARFDNQSLENYLKEYNLDREKTFRYYLFPADDLAAVYWGYIFEGIKCRCVLVEDNFLRECGKEFCPRLCAWERHPRCRMVSASENPFGRKIQYGLFCPYG